MKVLDHPYDSQPVYDIYTGRTNPAVFLQEARGVLTAILVLNDLWPKKEVYALEVFSGDRSRFADYISNEFVKSGGSFKNLTLDIRNWDKKGVDINLDIRSPKLVKQLKSARPAQMASLNFVYNGSEDQVCVENESGTDGIQAALNNIFAMLPDRGAYSYYQSKSPIAHGPFESLTLKFKAWVPIDSEFRTQFKLYNDPLYLSAKVVSNSIRISDHHYRFEEYLREVKLHAYGDLYETFKFEKPNVINFYSIQLMMQMAMSAGFSMVHCLEKDDTGSWEPQEWMPRLPFVEGAIPIKNFLRYKDIEQHVGRFTLIKDVKGG